MYSTLTQYIQNSRKWNQTITPAAAEEIQNQKDNQDKDVANIFSIVTCQIIIAILDRYTKDYAPIQL